LRRRHETKGDIVKTTQRAIFALAAIGILVGASNAFARGAKQGPVIYVESQGLYFDTFVAATELPMNGPFQELYPCDEGVCTEFGPGDPGHYGGRWWIDSNGNREMDAEDQFFLCPLLGPGRETP